MKRWIRLATSTAACALVLGPVAAHATDAPRVHTPTLLGSPGHKAHRWLYPIKVPPRYQAHGPGVAYPDRTDDTRFMWPKDQLVLACIRYHESRDRLDYATSAGGGWYGIPTPVWIHWRAWVNGLPMLPQRASGDQQSLVAMSIVGTEHGYTPLWSDLKGVCFK